MQLNFSIHRIQHYVFTKSLFRRFKVNANLTYKPETPNKRQVKSITGIFGIIE